MSGDDRVAPLRGRFHGSLLAVRRVLPVEVARETEAVLLPARQRVPDGRRFCELVVEVLLEDAHHAVLELGRLISATAGACPAA